MAGRIRDESIAEIREATDVVALVGEYVTLRPGGGTRMKGLCPFHQEKTPSFTVDSGRSLFHCFGCGQGGDAIDFLMKQETLSFTEAVERLAHRSGIELRYEGRSAGERGSMGRKSRLVAAHAEAVGFYHRALVESPDGRTARAYLSSRGVDRAVAERFQLGWAPGGSWEALVGHLRGKGFRPEELTEAGLARTGARGLRDAFHARVLFPIFDVAGDPVAFGGRLLDVDEGRGPKYVNTAETPIWHKGRALYALNWAKSEIVKAGFAVVVEGYTDVIACHQAGVPQAVATCGTALRAEHFKLLGRFTGRIVLAFDADAAGGRAAGRGVAELVAAPEASLSAHVLTMPAGLDPAEYVGRYGGDAFRELVEAAQPLVRWWLDWKLATFDLSQPEGKVLAARELVPLLRSVPDGHAADRVRPLGGAAAAPGRAGVPGHDRRPAGGPAPGRGQGAAALAQPPGPGRVRGPQVRPPAPGLDRRGGRALGPGLVQHPGDPGRVRCPDRRRRPRQAPGGRPGGRRHRDRPSLPARPGRGGVRGRGKPGVR